MPSQESTGTTPAWHRYLDGEGELDWRLLGLVTVAHAEGPDASRSAAGRAGAEAIWLPTALLPRFRVRWTAAAGDQVTARYQVGQTPLEVTCRWMRTGASAG